MKDDNESVNKAWESRKGSIFHLYVECGATLDQLMSQLAHEGFTSTKRQYKKRLKEWGFHKNIRRGDATQMLKVRHMRAVQGKATIFEINGRPIDIDTYLKRTRIFSSRSRSSHDITTELPRYIRCRTPQPIARSLDAPDTARVEELVFAYYRSLSPSAASLFPRPQNPHVKQIWGLVQLLKNLHRASWLFSERQYAVAGSLARLAFSQLDSLHDSAFPEFILVALYTSSMCPISGDLILSLWRYLAARAKNLHSQEAFTTKLTVEIFEVLQKRGSNIYSRLIPEVMLRLHELDTDERDMQIACDFIGTMNMCMDWENKKTLKSEIGRLIRKSVDSGIRVVTDAPGRKALEAYARALEVASSTPEQQRQLCFSNASQLKSPPTALLSEWMYYSSLAREERSHCADQDFRGNPRLALACSYLERSILVWLDEAEPEPHIIMDLRMLERWCLQFGDVPRAIAARLDSEKTMRDFVQRCRGAIN